MVENKDAKLILVPMPCDLNSQGSVFGGWIMSQMDLAGAVAAKEITNDKLVTISAKIVFKAPIFLGDLVKIFTNINKIGNTSIDVNIDVFVERKRTINLVAQGQFVYVNIDDNGIKKKLKD